MRKTRKTNCKLVSFGFCFFSEEFWIFHAVGYFFSSKKFQFLLSSRGVNFDLLLISNVDFCLRLEWSRDGKWRKINERCIMKISRSEWNSTWILDNFHRFNVLELQGLNFSWLDLDRNITIIIIIMIANRAKIQS